MQVTICGHKNLRYFKGGFCIVQFLGDACLRAKPFKEVKIQKKLILLEIIYYL
jgi:hypothetical protein